MMPQTFRYGDSDSRVADLYLPAADARVPVVCLLHGGFWRLPYGRDEMAPVAFDLASRGYAVWNIEYRRIGDPGGGWPGTLEDAAAAIDHLGVLASRETHLDLRRVAVVGHSAGGHLALCAGARGDKAHRRFSPVKVIPSAVCGLAAVTDLHRAFALNSGNSAVSVLLDGAPERHAARYEEASPRRLLPLGARQLILHGSEDDVLPVELSRAYVQAARAAGDTVDYMELSGGHMEYLDPAGKAHASLCSWLRTALE